MTIISETVISHVERGLPNGKSEISKNKVKKYLNENLIVAGRFGDLDFNSGLVWEVVSDRSAARYLHGLLFLSDWVESIKIDKTGVTAQAAFLLIDTWRVLQEPQSKKQHPMAFHDETTAQRLRNLVAVYSPLKNYLSEVQLSVLRSLMSRTAKLLSMDDFHATGNNHGMFQDLSLRDYSVIARWESDDVRYNYLQLSNQRLNEYFTASFTSEGVHSENTPTYHLMISRHLAEHVHFLNIFKEFGYAHLSQLLAGASRYATHAIMPNGMFPPISDTKQLPLKNHVGRIYDDSCFDYSASLGVEGTEPHERVALFPESGYAIYRSSWQNADAFYVMFQSAYNSGYHKHSDDLSLFIMGKGIDIISEAGPYGYNYKEPLTIYGYSQYAHNNVVVNGKSVRRTDDQQSTVSMSVGSISDSGFTVTGKTGRLDRTLHSRTVSIQEIDGFPEIDVFDSLESESNSSYEMFWNLGVDIEVVIHGQGFELFYRGKKVMDALIEASVATRVSLHEGEMGRRPLGWTFPSFGESVPSKVLRVKFAGRAAEVKTKFRTSNFNFRDRGLNVAENDWKRSNSSPSLNYHLKRSSAENKPLIVVFSAINPVGDFTYNYKTTLDRFDVNVLYILDDFGDQGSYYMQDHSDTGIFQSVQDLISQVIAVLGIDMSKVTAIGSSKGGTGALIHGIAAGVGHIFIGAPQVRLGYFLSKPHPNIVRFMTKRNAVAPLDDLDAIVPNVLRSNDIRSSVHLVVGEADHHFRHHAIPLRDEMAALGYSLDLKVVPGTPHAEIGRTFREYLGRLLPCLIAETFVSISQLETTLVNPVPGSLHLSFATPVGCSVYFKVYLGREIVAERGYSAVGDFQWYGLAPGRYRVRVFVREDSTKKVVAFSTDRVQVRD